MKSGLIYVHTGGVAFQGQGLEIRDSIKPEEKKAQLKGYHDGRGTFVATLAEAKARASTGDLLYALLKRQAGYR